MPNPLLKEGLRLGISECSQYVLDVSRMSFTCALAQMIISQFSLLILDLLDLNIAFKS